MIDDIPTLSEAKTNYRRSGYMNAQVEEARWRYRQACNKSLDQCLEELNQGMEQSFAIAKHRNRVAHAHLQVVMVEQG